MLGFGGAIVLFVIRFTILSGICYVVFIVVIRFVRRACGVWIYGLMSSVGFFVRSVVRVRLRFVEGWLCWISIWLFFW